MVEADLVEALQEFGPIRYSQSEAGVGVGYSDELTPWCPMCHQVFGWK